jgi:photosystem II stability/assembly factor-like uncharacterized protein
MKKLYILLFALFMVNGAIGQWFWQNPLPQGNLLSSVFFTDANTGYAVGYDGTILKTTNGGTDWTAQSSGTTKWLHLVYFTDANTGYAVGYDGTIIKTTNGGTDWTALSSGTTAHLLSVCFTDANIGYAVGGSGTIFKTTNGGTDWTAQSSGAGWNSLNSVYFTDANTGYAVGDGGTILKTLNGGYPGWIDDHNQTVANLLIYPNPTSSTIVIENIDKGKLSILNLDGQHLLQQQITAPVTNIDVSNLPNGIYMVKVVGEKGVQTGKFVKL